MKTDRWYSRPTQVFWTCQALVHGRTISTRTEIREVRGWRLGAIVHTLRDRYGWPIVTDLRGPDNVAHYSLPSDVDRKSLRFPPSARALAQEGGAA